SNFNFGFRPVFHTEVGHACGINGDGTSFYRDLSGNIGISGTPVIDRELETLFAVTRTVENGTFVQRLRAIDTRSGHEPLPAATIGTIDAQTNHQQAALALWRGRVYLGW